MRATVLHGPRDVRVEDRPDPAIEQPTDAIIRLAAAYARVVLPTPGLPKSRGFIGISVASITIQAARVTWGGRVSVVLLMGAVCQAIGDPPNRRVLQVP